MKRFIESQFNYCPLIWMFHSQTIINKSNRLHERAVRIVYSDFKSSFEGLLLKENSFSIHERNVQSFAIEIYKFVNGLSPSFLNNVFRKNISNSQDLRNHKELYSRNPKTDMELKLFHIQHLSSTKYLYHVGFVNVICFLFILVSLMFQCYILLQILNYQFL